jgi:Cu+-exporting ATPase
VRAFQETTGCGIAGTVDGREIRMGSAAWMESAGVPVRSAVSPGRANDGTIGRVDGSVVHVAIDGVHRGCFVLEAALRPETRQLIEGLSVHCELALLSGDRDQERERFNELFGAHRPLLFQQSPLDKLEFIRHWQQSGRTVMMVGDGLNDAGALQQSDVGVAVVERLHAFSPACDVIAAADLVPHLEALLKFARSCVRVVRSSFVISSLYNVIGISIAASGHLSPLVCAILMPVSSITVVGFACGATTWMAWRHLRGVGTTADRTATSAASGTDAEESRPDARLTEAMP